MTTHTELARSILSRIPYITLATASSTGLPWSSPVYAAFDDDFNFYWLSAYQARHSENIRENNQVAFVIYDSTVQEGTGQGVYVQAMASELSAQDEVAHGLHVIAEREGEEPLPVSSVGERSPMRVYKAQPQATWINIGDNVNGIIVDTRLAIDLSK